MNQYNLLFKNKTSYTIDNYLISDSNREAFDFLIKKRNDIRFLFLYGPNKSGKSHISKIWLNQYDGISIKVNNLIIDDIIHLKKNILIDNVFENINEEKLFYLINHYKDLDFKLLITSNTLPKNYIFEKDDLSSRIKSFHFLQIYQPDDTLINNLIIKLFYDLQFKIKNKDVVNYISSHIDRSFDSVYSLIKQIDEYSLTNKREITIPLVKKIIKDNIT